MDLNKNTERVLTVTEKEQMDLIKKVEEILAVPEQQQNVWPVQDSDDFDALLKSKTDACAKFMLETMIECVALYKAKNTDYGDAFGKTYAQFGVNASLIRISDKINRLTALLKRKGVSQEVANESVRDTFMDLVNYSLMTLYEMHRDTGGAK